VAFGSVVGHDRLKGLLMRALEHDRLPPALLFAGPEGVGKRTLAMTVARGLLCAKGPGEPCESCVHCSRIARGLHPDVLAVAAETAAIKIEQVRDVVREILGLPFEARARVVVIDDAHTMTEQAMNALLKSLEEPPATSHVILVTHAPQALLQTIRSRCQAVRFGPLPTVTLEAVLTRSHGMDPVEAHLRAVLSGGSLGAALAFEAEGYRAVRDEVLAVLEKLPASGALHRLEAAEKLGESDDPLLALTAARSLLRDAAALRAGADPSILLNSDAADRLHALVAGPLGARAVELAEAIEETRASLRGNASKPIAMDALLDRLAG
jgi:DNA polymerase-3 subunit delta'